MSAQQHLRDIERAAVITAALRLHDEFTEVIVDVADGVVILEGHVSTGEQRQAAETLVRGLYHTVGIRNALKLEKRA